MEKPTIEIQKSYNPSLIKDYDDLLASLHMTESYTHIPDRIRDICESDTSSLYLSKIAMSAVGMAILVHPYKTFEHSTAVIEDVAVKSGYKGYGIGNLLISTLITDAKEMGASRIELHSNKKRTAARSLYAKHGFNQIDTDLFRLNLGE
jgi:ribosomal protein S18 acetylase RimI-like enzyme